MSPFIWKVRQDIVNMRGSDNARTDIPVFMIIGGVARSGKTTALDFVSLLMGNNKKRYFAYKDMSEGSVLFDLFHTENLFPILVDEIEPPFFYKNVSHKKGEGFIKYISNDLGGKHPVLIGTTNKNEFSSSSQIIRRIYYIEINNIFDESLKAESMEYLNNIIKRSNDRLFRDFTFRMGEMINNGEEFYKTNDILHFAREIFKQYYKEAGLEIPKWFPKKPFDDVKGKKENTWRNLYYSKKKFFKKKDTNTMFIFIDEMIENSKDRKQREKLINFLDDTCIKENGVVLEVYTDKFLEFIGLRKRDIIIRKIKEIISKK